MLALDLLRVVLANRVLLRFEMTLVGTPAIGVIGRDAKRLQQRFEWQEDLVLTPSKHLGQQC